MVEDGLRSLPHASVNLQLRDIPISHQIAKAVKHTTKAQPPQHTSSSSSSSSSSHIPPPKQKKSKKDAAYKAELLAVDKFVSSILDPDECLARYPLGKTRTATAGQVISIIGDTYSAEGFVNLYVTNDPEYPVAISALTAKTYTAGTHPALTIVQPIEAYGNQSSSVYAPLTIDQTLVFNAPVSFADGSNAPGYHITINTSSLSFTVFHGAGLTGKLRAWHRTGGAKVYITDVNIIPTNVTSVLSIPSGSTGFGFEYVFNTNVLDRFVYTTTFNTGSEVVIGNHASYAVKKSIPDLDTLRMRQSRVIGLKSHIKFDGADLYNAGRIASAQFPPGVYPGQFKGSNAYEQIINSRVKSSYHGRFDKGAVSRFIAPHEESYLLTSEPSRFGEDGFIVMTFSSLIATPQPYEITVSVSLEFTSSSTAYPLSNPDFAQREMVNHAFRVLSTMNLHTENPLHEYVKKLWDKLKKSAKKVVTNPEAWYTIADVVGTALLL